MAVFEYESAHCLLCGTPQRFRRSHSPVHKIGLAQNAAAAIFARTRRQFSPSSRQGPAEPAALLPTGVFGNGESSRADAGARTPGLTPASSAATEPIRRLRPREPEASDDVPSRNRDCTRLRRREAAYTTFLGCPAFAARMVVARVRRGLNPAIGLLCPVLARERRPHDSGKACPRMSRRAATRARAGHGLTSRRAPPPPQGVGVHKSGANSQKNMTHTNFYPFSR